MAKALRILAVLIMATAAAVAATLAAPAARAEGFHPAIAVYLADGVTPAGNTQLHPGDVVVVKGTGFDPNANTSGLPVPVPPGVPHGTFVTFGKFADDWRPSQGAPESARPTDRAQTKWVLSRGALDRVPDVPFDLRRTVRQQWVPLAADGTFTARLVLTEPKRTVPGGTWGVYTFGGADAVNAAQELRVPLNFSTAPGPNTPQPAPRNLVWAYSPGFADTVRDTAQGGLTGSNGGSVGETGALGYELVGNTLRDGSGELRFRGTVVAHTRFHLAEIALADPVIRVTNGTAVLSMRTSTTDMNGTDALRRVDIADLTLSRSDLARLERGEDVSGIPAAFRPGITPATLAALSAGPASPVSVHF